MQLTVCTLEGERRAGRPCVCVVRNVGRRAISSTSTRSLLLTVNRGNTHLGFYDGQRSSVGWNNRPPKPLPLETAVAWWWGVSLTMRSAAARRAARGHVAFLQGNWLVPALVNPFLLSL